MEPIQLFCQECEDCGRVAFIEYLPDKTIVSASVLEQFPDVLIVHGDTLTISALNGWAAYALKPIDDDYYYATFNEWHLYDKPILSHP